MKSVRSPSKTYPSGSKDFRRGRNNNPTGDIWDQKSLNLDTLFNVSVNHDLKIGIWNAQSVRTKENLVKNAFLIMT